MRIKYNFAFKDSKLSPWTRPAPPNLLVSDASLKKKIIFLYQEFNKNSAIFYPSSMILILSAGIYFLNIFPNLTIKQFEDDHNEYLRISTKLSNINSSKQRYRKNLKNIEEYFAQPTPSYLFAFYLQNSVPKGVKINSYSFSDNGFDINVSAFNLDSLNEFITLIMESPILQKSTITVSQINRVISNNEENNSSKFDLEIYGLTEKIDIKMRENLYLESNANGLLRKLKRFNYLKLLLRG